MFRSWEMRTDISTHHLLCHLLRQRTIMLNLQMNIFHQHQQQREIYYKFNSICKWSQIAKMINLFYFFVLNINRTTRRPPPPPTQGELKKHLALFKNVWHLTEILDSPKISANQSSTTSSTSISTRTRILATTSMPQRWLRSILLHQRCW